MAFGVSISTLAIAAILFYRWQRGLPHQATALLMQAEQANKLGNLVAAEKACLQAVAIAGRTWLDSGGIQVQTLYALAVIYLEENKLAGAEQIALKAMTAARKMGSKSPLSTSLVALLARIYKGLGKDLAACPVFQVSVPMLRAQYGPDSQQVGVALHELGVTFSRIGVPERAIEVLQECIPIFEKRLGKDHHDVASAYINLGKAQSNAKLYADAERSYRTALALIEAKSGTDDPEVALVLNNLAVTYKNWERIAEALECLRRSLTLREAKLGPNHPQVGLVLNNIANCLRLQKQYSDAETAVLRAKAILENPQHQAYPTVLDSLASLRAAQGRFEEADRLFLQCLKIQESRPSSNLIALAETCERYADVLYKLQREAQADAMLEKVNDLRAARERLVLLPAAPAA